MFIMRKAISSACLLALICFAATAWAGKPKLAILGLEVAPGPTGVVDPAMTQVAKDITRELRQRAQAGSSAYVVAPNSSKELTDEKLLMSCDNEARDCMAMIGAGLAADALLYGHVEKKGEVYRVSLKLLDVKAKTVELGGDEMPVGGAVTGVSKRLYNKLIGEAPGAAGGLVVTARSQSGASVDGGKVMVDEDRRGVLSGGKLTVTGLTEGRHVVAIEVGGLQRFEATVAVHAGEQSTLDALLLARAVVPSRTSHAQAWKVTLGVSLGLAAVGGGLAGYGAYQQDKSSGNYTVLLDPSNGNMPFANATAPDQSDCGRSNTEINTLKHTNVTDRALFDSACKWHTANIAGFVVLGVGGAAAVVSLIMLIRDPGTEERSPTGTRQRKPDVAIAPLLGPALTGAALSVTW
jgi:hypothetical protein